MYWVFMILVFPSQNVGGMDLPSPVDNSDNTVSLRYIRHLLSSTIYSPLILLLIKCSMICESLRHWGFRIGVFSSTTMFFSQGNFRMLVIHELGIHLVRGWKLLYNRVPENHMSSLWYYVESLRCCSLMQSLFPRFIRGGMCFHPCLP